MDEQKEIKQLKGVVRRRKKAFVIASSAIFLLGLVIAFALPPIYLSRTTILIENQQIPEEYVQTTITGYVEERLQVITQQIMSRTRLLEVIKQFNLYADLQSRYTTEEIIEGMRDDIHLETISADVIDRRTGRPTAATIAFTLSYEGADPSTVQKVSSVLASLYLEQNLKSREQRASNTTTFLQQELDELKGQIDTFQKKISEFKTAHTGALPEHIQINLQASARLEMQLDQMDMQIRSLQERKIYLEGQAASVDPLTPVVTEDGKTIMHPKERLKFLRLQLISLQSALAEKHPDIKKLKREIDELEAQVGESDDSLAKVRRLSELQGQLAILEGKLGPKHPDVIKLSKEVELLTKEVENLQAEKATLSVAEKSPDNPAYISLMTQIASTEMEIKGLVEEKENIKQKIDIYQRKIENAPVVEKEYNDLTRDYENAKYKYNEIMTKLMEARVAQGMEESQQGERFTIIDPAQLPEKPFKPNRVAIILIGFVLALGAGVGLAAAQESLDTSIKTAEEINAVTGLPVFSVISLMETDEERRARRIRGALFALGTIVVMIVALVLVDRLVMPLDILWIKIQRRMMMLGLPI
jgi:succinoglycan biosynthesis transport protein ExoP